MWAAKATRIARLHRTQAAQNRIRPVQVSAADGDWLLVGVAADVAPPGGIMLQSEAGQAPPVIVPAQRVLRIAGSENLPAS